MTQGAEATPLWAARRQSVFRPAWTQPFRLDLGLQFCFRYAAGTWSHPRRSPSDESNCRWPCKLSVHFRVMVTTSSLTHRLPSTLTVHGRNSHGQELRDDDGGPGPGSAQQSSDRSGRSPECDQAPLSAKLLQCLCDVGTDVREHVARTELDRITLAQENVDTHYRVTIGRLVRLASKLASCCAVLSLISAIKRRK